MQISVETIGALERRLTISVPSQTFEGQITERLGKAAGEIKLPGFRPGKVPMKEVRRRYGPAVRAEVAGELMQASFVDAVRSEELSPAGSPNLEVVKMDPGIDFEFTATFEVFPAVEITDLSRVAVRKPQAELSELDIDEMVERLREQRKEWTDLDRGAQEGDRVTLDFTGMIDDEAFEGGSGEGISFIVGAGQMIKDFDTGVTGLAAGSSDEFQATFPDDYRVEELRDKEATFKVTIDAVAQPTLPDLDEEFFKAFDVEEGGVEAFRADVRANMQREMDAAIDNQVKNQVIDQLNELHTIQLPTAMVRREIDVLKSQMQQQFQMYGTQAGDQPDLPDELFQDQGERRVAVGLIVNKIVADANIEADPDKVRDRVETLAEQYAEPQQVVNYYFSNAEPLQQIEMAVLEDQVVDYILEQSSVEVLPSNYTDIISGKAIPEPDPPAMESDADSEDE
ncbi:MAG: trigger factor [Pseudomonadales bacterium]